MISIIIPARNETATLSAYLQALQGLRVQGHELIVVDGQSSDDTLTQASAWVDNTLSSPPGRAIQMNLGAQHAKGEVLLFLHADTRLPEQADQLIEAALQQRHWGRFDVRLSGRHRLLRVVERMMNWRSCLSGMATGDQGIFMRRAAFEALGGYPELPLMEDLALSKRLRRAYGWPVCIHQPLITSSRRWEQHGILRTILLMWTLRLAWFLGVPAKRLVARYHPSGRPSDHPSDHCNDPPASP